MYSNTPQSVFYANEPNKGERPLTSYRAAVPGKDGTCVAMIAVRAGVGEETVKKIAATLAASH
jgi:hypothetical protein